MKSLLLNFFLLCVFLTNAQTKQIKAFEGKEYKESNKKFFKKMFAQDEKGYYGLRTKGDSKIWLEHYNQDLVSTKSVEHSLKEGKKDKNYEFIIESNNKIYLFTSYKNVKTKHYTLYVQSVNKQTLSLNNDLKKVFETDFLRKRKKGVFGYKKSEDNSKIVIYFKEPYNKKEIIVIDENMKTLWDKQLSFDYNNSFFIENYEIDNQGNVYLLGTTHRDIGEDEEKPNYYYQIIGCYNAGKTKQTYPIKINDNFVTEMKMKLNKNQNIVCAGFYTEVSSESRGNNIMGSFFIKINKNSKKIITKKFNKFSFDFITQNMRKREKKRVEKKRSKNKTIQLSNYHLKDLILREDGGVYVVGEQSYVDVVKSSYTDANGKTITSSTYHHYYLDLIVVNLSSKGEMVWAEEILKSQHTVNDGGSSSSYFSYVKDNKISFVFNDHELNFKKNDKNEYYFFNKHKKTSTLVLVEVDLKGQKSKKIIFPADDYPIILKPRYKSKVSKNEFILFGQRKKINKLVKLTFDDKSSY